MLFGVLVIKNALINYIFRVIMFIVHLKIWVYSVFLPGNIKMDKTHPLNILDRQKTSNSFLPVANMMVFNLNFCSLYI